MKHLSLNLAIILFAAFLMVTSVNAQTAANPNAAIEAEIRKSVLAYWAASDNRDEAGVLKIEAEDGVFYDLFTGLLTREQLKNNVHPYFAETAADRTKYTTTVEGFNVLVIDPKSAVANYTTVSSISENGKTKTDRNYVTEVFVLRNGSWQIVAEHLSKIPKPVEPITAGLPAGWQRTPGGTGDQYSINVDKNVRHGGTASASIRFSCGSLDESWASLGQAVAADDYRGKRVRLTGWLKTADAEGAGIWMRIDGEKHMFGFDNMSNRLVKGTTDWKQYSVVLDVPAEAVNIYFGTLVWENGQVWSDDFALEIVDKSVASTDINGGGPKEDNPAYANLKRSDKKKPVNMGFEDGAVK